MNFAFDFTINTMLDFEDPFAKNELPTLGKWHQCLSVVDKKRFILFLHGNLPYFCNFALKSFFHTLGFLEKNYGNIFHLFGGSPPIMRPLSHCFWGLSLHPSCCGSFKPSSCGGTIFSSEEKINVDSPSTSSFGFSFKDLQLSNLTSSSSFTTTCITCFEGGLLSWTPSTFFVPLRNTKSRLLMILLVSTHLKQYALVLL